jgi:hypothetical protein
LLYKYLDTKYTAFGAIETPKNPYVEIYANNFEGRSMKTLVYIEIIL